MLCNLSVDADTICSPAEDITECTTYLPGYINAASSSAFSDHSLKSAIFPFITSSTLNVTPEASFSLMRRPELLRASTNIRHSGHLKAQGSVLSAANLQHI